MSANNGDKVVRWSDPQFQPNKLNNNDTVPNNGWVKKGFKNNLNGLLSWGTKCMKKIQMSHPVSNPEFLTV